MVVAGGRALAAALEMPAPAVFLSYAATDKDAAEALCAAVERCGIPCWVAPRDVVAGASWPQAITDALHTCRVVVLLLSRAANKSRWVPREIERATSMGRTIVPIRLDKSKPGRELELFVGGLQWIDACPSAAADCPPRLLVALRQALAAPCEDPPDAATDGTWQRLELTGEVLENLKDERKEFRLLLLGAMVACALAVLSGVVMLAFETVRPGITALLTGVFCLPVSWWWYSRYRDCGDYVGILSVAIRTRNEVVARNAISRLSCFPNVTKELLR